MTEIVYFKFREAVGLDCPSLPVWLSDQAEIEDVELTSAWSYPLLSDKPNFA